MGKYKTYLFSFFSSFESLFKAKVIIELDYEIWTYVEVKKKTAVGEMIGGE